MSRILLADDSATARHLVRTALAAEPDVSFLPDARNGREALRLVSVQPPDLLVADLDMPEMDGFALLSAVRQDFPQVPVIVFSASALPGSAEESEALKRGAAAVIAKPSRTADPMGDIRSRLLPAIRRAAGVAPPEPAPRPSPAAPQRPAVAAAAPARPPTAAAPPPPRTAGTGPSPHFDLLVIGSSTGGPGALETLLAGLPAPLGVPVVIVQHMPAGFTARLADHLRTTTGHDVREASYGVAVEPGVVWIAPGNLHLVVRKRSAGLQALTVDGPKLHACRPAVDVLFTSAAEATGPRTLAAVLTGMGRDGEDGSRAIRLAGGTILAQDEASSVVYGMPRAVVEARLAHQVVSIDHMAAVMLQRLQVSSLAAARP
jgi:two-component system chemotaxis response regulator CheB